MPEEREGQADWDPFFQPGRGKRSREDRKQRRLANEEVQERREKGLKEGYPDLPPQQKTPGSNSWRQMREMEKARLQEERAIQEERNRLLEEREAFLEEKERWLQSKEEGITLRSVSPQRPERRPVKYMVRKTRHRDGSVSYVRMRKDEVHHSSESMEEEEEESEQESSGEESSQEQSSKQEEREEKKENKKEKEEEKKKDDGNAASDKDKGSETNSPAVEEGLKEGQEAGAAGVKEGLKEGHKETGAADAAQEIDPKDL